MTQSTQGIIIALLISLLIGVIIGFYLRQSRINHLANALKQQQKRAEEIEQEHEQRLQVATGQLQKDYERQLADTIERYQTQYNAQVNHLEAEYDARLSMVGPTPADMNPAAAPGAGSGTSADAIAIEQRIRKQYEDRLKEAAQKIQQAYEQHLKVKLNESRDALQKDYEKRLAEKIEHYQDQFDEKLAQATSAPAMPMMAAMAPYGNTDPGPMGAVIPMAEVGAPVNGPASTLEASLRQEYEQKLAKKIEHYQDDMAQRMAALEQEWESRLRMASGSQPMAAPTLAPEQEQALRSELENRITLELEDRYRKEYDKRLAEVIERYQDEMVQRTQELEREFEARLQLVQQQGLGAAPGSPPGGGSSGSVPMAVPVSPPGGVERPEGGTPFPGDQTIDPAIIENALFSDPVGSELDFDFSQPAASSGPSAEDLALDFEPREPTPPPAAAPSTNDLDLDDLLTMNQSSAPAGEQPPLDDGGFDLAGLEALLQDQDDPDSDDLFGTLDDLSNLS